MSLSRRERGRLKSIGNMAGSLTVFARLPLGIIADKKFRGTLESLSFI